MSKRSRKREATSATPSAPVAGLPAAATASGLPATATEAESTSSWFDSSDPRRRLWARVILAGVWIYVAALWLLALDQTFNWGIFGPKVPPTP